MIHSCAPKLFALHCWISAPFSVDAFATSSRLPLAALTRWYSPPPLGTGVMCQCCPGVPFPVPCCTFAPLRPDPRYTSRSSPLATFRTR